MSELTPRAGTRRDATAEQVPPPVLAPPGLTSLQMLGATDADACTDGVCALPEEDA